MAKANGWLDADTFEMVVATTPLTSIDLLVENEQGESLLGLRTKPPRARLLVCPRRACANE